ncbi:hypothetical protein LCGC14_0622740 [marine sediment metagenome]|uniref:Uncharacterized protein n=1 Tax=marine sediment metagenome TaxID=412755 RepID=A0A0F9UCX3_9ZZZZ
MGFIDYGGHVGMFRVDKDCVQLCTIRNTASCSICRAKLPKGSKVLSKDGWKKFCLDCQPILFARIRGEFRNFDAIMKQTEADLKINMEKYKTQNIVSLI